MVKGSTVTVTTILLLLISVAIASMFFAYVTRLKANVESTGEKQLIELKIPPKLLSLVCYDGYGYMLLSLSQGQSKVSGTVQYQVELDTGKMVSDGLIDLNLQGTGYVYIPYLFDTSERYLVSLSGKRWKISEYCRPINDPNMVLYLPMDEASGTTTSDQSDYGNDGIITGATWTGGKSGNALSFDGDPDYISVSNSENLNISDKLTITAWVLSQNFSISQIIVDTDPGGLGGTENGYEFSIASQSDGDSGFYFAYGNGTNEGIVSTQYNVLLLNNWYFVSVVLNGTTAKAFVDSVEKASSIQNAANIRPAQNSLTIGWQNCGGCSYDFNGTIDEVRVYDRALSDEEISALYDAYMGGR